MNTGIAGYACGKPKSFFPNGASGPKSFFPHGPNYAQQHQHQHQHFFSTSTQRSIAQDY